VIYAGAMTDERDPVIQAEDDEIARMIDALEEAGLTEVYERPDGTAAVRLTQQGEDFLRDLPEHSLEEPPEE